MDHPKGPVAVLVPEVGVVSWDGLKEVSNSPASVSTVPVVVGTDPGMWVRVVGHRPGTALGT